MKGNIKGYIRDLLKYLQLTPGRRKRFAQAPVTPRGVAPMNQLAQRLHPGRQHLVIAGVTDETKSTKTFKLIPDADSATKELAYFRAGQYLSLKVEVNGVRITRPYSIASAPYQALGANGFYEITLRKKENGFLTSHVWESWKTGVKVESSGPCGQFYYEPLRDAPKMVALAGGSGITPFRSLALEMVHQTDLTPAEMLLLYGSSAEDDIVYFEQFKALEVQSAGRLKVIHVLSCEETSLEGCELGFITADTIKKYADIPHSTFFVCGPQVMYTFAKQELATLNLPARRIRWEVFGEVPDVTQSPDFPQAAVGQAFQITVHIGGLTTQISASATETILVALERANLAPPSQCRSGECGFCHTQLITGEVYSLPDHDGRRAADRQFGYIHPCAAYPLSNLEITMPRDA